jgi:histone-lysine N-methyltransferase SETMAR
MDQKLRIRERLLHEFQLGNSAAQARRNINQAMGQDALSKTMAEVWFQNFRRGSKDIEDRPRSGRPQLINRTAVLAAIEESPTLTTGMLAEDFDCTNATINRILHELGKTYRHGRWLPHELTQLNKNGRVEASTELLARFKQCTFLDRLITCDEKWISFYNPKRLGQWRSRGQLPVSQPKPDWRLKKAMLCVWWWRKGIIHWELLDEGATITATYYCDQLNRVAAKLRDPAFAALVRKKIVFLQDNAKPHKAKMTMAKLVRMGWEALNHPAYSPDLAPSDYHLFRSMQHSLAGQRFVNRDQVENHISQYFDSKSQDFYERGIELLPEKWQKVIDQAGAYFE